MSNLSASANFDLDGSDFVGFLQIGESLAGIGEEIKGFEPASKGDLDKLLEEASYNNLLIRGQEAAEYTGSVDVELNEAVLREAILRLTVNENGEEVDAKIFELRLNQLYGAVTTGHPVFGLPPKLAGKLTQYFTHLAGENPDQEKTQQLESELKEANKEEHQPPSVVGEREQSFVGLENMHAVSRLVEKIGIEVAKEKYPDQWDKIDYMPMSIATWIPFDWDGRKDVEWSDLMRERILLQTRMLDSQIIPDFEALKKSLPDSVDTRALEGVIDKLSNTSSIMNDQFEFYQDYNQSEDADLKALNENEAKLIQTKDQRITHPKELIDSIEAILEQNDMPEDVKTQMVQMRSRLKNHGIAFAHPHFRINGKSVKAGLSQHAHNGSRIDPKTEDEAMDEVALPLVANMLKFVQVEDTNLNDLVNAEETIMKQMLFIRETKDLIDSHSSNRYLVAETHNATTLLATLYFAKLNGVDDIVDISPLFEDGPGVDNAISIMTKMFQNEDFVNYVRRNPETQYRLQQVLAVEFGYSDISRFEGTIPSGAYNEKAKSGLLNAIENAGLSDTIFVCYDTLGEGYGRSKDPKSLEDGIGYVSSKFYNELARDNKQTVKYERSFQGQDGYMQIGTFEAALKVVSASINHVVLDGEAKAENDSYYGALKGQARAFFKTARLAHTELSEGKENALLIDVFKNFLPQTGSRPVTRDASTGGERKLPRAIQHNGTLQQLGMLATMTYGIGESIKKNGHGFNDLMNESDVFRGKMKSIYKVMDLADLDVMEGYIQIYNPDYWRAKARQVQDPERKNKFNNISKHVRNLDMYTQLSTVVAQIRDDFDVIQKSREGLDLKDDPMKDPKYKTTVSRKKHNMRVANGARFAATVDFFEKAMDIPDFSKNGGHTRDKIIDRALTFDPHVFDDMNSIFGQSPERKEGNLIDQLKPTTLSDGATDYSRFRENVMKPMQDNVDVIKRASIPTMHAYGAVG